MILPNLQYPRFVPDQVLTSDNLDDLFNYLDDQDRITRTNLIGIGIVCGLNIETANDGTSIKITRGTGITSEGYLVAQEETSYTEYLEQLYDPAKEDVYNKFQPLGSRTIQLWELKETAAVAGTKALSLAFLNGNGVDDDKKIVLLFVELLKEDNKNCNPESCDDKGLTINVNLRPMLVRKTDVAAFGLANGLGGILFNQGYAKLPEMRMRRFDVANTGVVTTADLFTAYKKILTPDFLKSVDKLLTDAWSQFKTVITDEYKGNNPFPGLPEAFSFLNDNSIDVSELQTVQYCYDYFSDLLCAYEEFRVTGMEVLNTCCPDSTLFPRHLLLDLAVPDSTSAYSKYRHYFNYSPLFQKRDLYGRLDSLFNRLVVMTKTFKVPPSEGANDKVDPLVRITPSRLDASPISSKAIPYYYKPQNPLYEYWDYEKTQAAASETNLSYHAKERPNSTDFVKQPLAYDLEPFNFLRIEGHVGKPFAHVLFNIQTLIDQDRLPIDVIALALGTDASGTDIADSRYFQEIQLQFELLRNEALCCLKTQLPYWANLEVTVPPKGSFAAVNIKNGLKFEIAMAAPVKTELPMKVLMVRGVSVADTPQAGGQMMPVIASNKSDVMNSILSSYSTESLASKYLKYQANGDFTLSQIPDPDPVFDAPTITQFALIIVDEINAILVLLRSETIDTLDVDGLAAHNRTLTETIAKLGDLIDKHLENQKPVQKIKAYVTEAKYGQVDRIADAMAAISDDAANSLILLLLNLSDTDLENMIKQLQSQSGNATQQAATITANTAKLDKDGMMIPMPKDVTYVDDPVLKEMKDKLRDFSCLCGLGGFKEMQVLLQKLVDQLRQSNLFYQFSKKHPGLQHKAGVPMGGTFVVAYHQKGAKSPNQPDPAYEKVSETLPPGTVVADFYLPYICCSNESPLVFQVSDAAPQAITPTLSLQPNPQTNSSDYSIGDEKQYAFTHTPDGGTLNNGAEANGVTTSGSDNYLFTPSKVQGLGNSDSLDVTFSYTKQGLTGSDLKVTVYSLPKATIAGPASTNVQVGAKLSFTSTIQSADKFNWTVTDSAGGSTSVSNTQSLDNWTAAAAGVFIISLAVTQSKTGAQTISNSINVTVKNVPVKTCGSLVEILAGFSQLSQLDAAATFAKFSKVLDELGITALFKQLSDVAKQPEETQLGFFSTAVQQQIIALLERLAGLIRNPDQKDTRLLTLAMYRLLVDLAMYIACIQKTDKDVDTRVFTAILSHLQGSAAAPGILSMKAGFSAKEQDALKALSTDIGRENARQNANNEIQPKPEYTKALQALLDLIKKNG